MDKFVVTSDVTKIVSRFNFQGRVLEFKINPVPEEEDAVSWVKEAINGVIEKGTNHLQPTDLVGFTFTSKDFSRGEGWLPFKAAQEVTYQDVWNVISNIYQSNSSGFNTDTFRLGITSVQLPTGKGRGKNYNTFEEECRSRKGIVEIKNRDNLCLPRALVVAKARADKDPDYKHVRQDTRKIQTTRSIQLLQSSGVVIPVEGGGIPELQKLQAYLNDYTITVYSYDTKGRDVIFKGPNRDKKLNLLFHEGHYNVITSLTATFVCNYFCEECHQPYDHNNSHRCGGTCPCCQNSPRCSDTEKQVKCAVCNRSFRGQGCYDNHKEKLCAQIRRCDTCLRTVKNGRQHVCGEIFCKVCNKHVPDKHLCYMPVNTQTPKCKGLLFIFYDLETRQETVTKDGLLHEPNLCVSEQRCDHCLNEKIVFCQKCGMRTHVFKEKPVERFMNYVMGMRKKFKKVVVIGHNGGGFDHQFVLNYIITKTDITPELIMRGTKLIVMDVGNIQFLDSLNYFPMALARLPKVFGLTELKKGHFPHLFNRMENEKYVGPLPPLECYGPNNMKEDARKELIQWYDKTLSINYVFDMQRELLEYCTSDVRILADSCIRFRQLMLESGNVCPFTEASTLPSACNKIYRRNYLKPHTIGIIPKGGYRWRDNQSIIATQWLLWLEKELGISIQHSAKGMEVKICGHKVDGFCAETNQIFEFHGCYFHGCTSCIRYNRDQPCYNDKNITMEQRYQDTVHKIQRLRDKGYEVVEIWECDFQKHLTEEIHTYTQSHPLMKQTPLNPRDAFYGGRTGAAKKYYKVEGEERIKYVDVCSLYPWTNKYGKYPVGHPKVYVGEECQALELRTTEGLIKCKILPPQNLYHPVLPVKQNAKLMFTLCCACSEQLNQSECTHNDEQRAISGTWVLDEVRKAIEKGYRILEIYEVWKYKTEQYNPETRTGGLFTEYMNKFLGIKQEASGWPPSCNSDEEKEKYVRQYLEREGVQLNPTQICKNPGLRQLGKAVITSFWGKLGQRENQGKTSIVNKTEQFFNILTDNAIIVNTVMSVNDDTMIVNWQHKEETYEPLSTVNVCLAAYTTALARLKLYSYLEKLGENVLYYDTDSVIYISKPGEYDVPLGSYLGDMTDELECYGEGSYINTFASGGPKMYTYRVYSPSQDRYHDTIKVKGICINHETAKTVNFETLCDMILKEDEPKYITTRQIQRTALHEVVTRKGQKIFRVNFKKRKPEGDYGTVPYGYKRMKTG